MAKRKEYNPRKNERDCRKFLKLMFSDGDVEKGYALLRNNLGLME